MDHTETIRVVARQIVALADAADIAHEVKAVHGVELMHTRIEKKAAFLIQLARKAGSIPPPDCL